MAQQSEQQLIIRRKRLLTAPDLPQLVVETQIKRQRPDPKDAATSGITRAQGGGNAFIPYKAKAEADDQEALDELEYWEGVIAAESAPAVETRRRVYRLANTQTHAHPAALGSSRRPSSLHGSVFPHQGHAPQAGSVDGHSGEHLQQKEADSLKGMPGADAGMCLEHSEPGSTAQSLKEFRGYQRKSYGAAIIIDIEDEGSSSQVQESADTSNYVYDFYVLDKEADLNSIDIHALVRVEDRVDDLIFGSDEEDSNSNDSDDSNAEGYYANEYPDEDEIHSWEERSDEDGGEKGNGFRDSDSSDEDDPSNYMHGYGKNIFSMNSYERFNRFSGSGKKLHPDQNRFGDDEEGDDDDEEGDDDDDGDDNFDEDEY